jgi:hypothetical protein
MKKVIVAIAALFAVGDVYAQADTVKTKSDTLVVGNFTIIKKNRPDKDTTDFEITKRKKKSNVSTNWAVFDLGFANFKDETVYGSPEANSYLQGGTQPFTKADMKLRTTKSSNVNIWIMQKLNVSKRILNLKYGVGLEMFNYRYSTNISYRETPVRVMRDTVDFSKNKLYVAYISVPFMVNFNFTPKREKGLSLSAGISAGYKIGSRNKQISQERGKAKIKGDFDLEQWRVAYMADLGLGPVRVFGSYSITPLHERGLKQYPYAVGIRFSNW